MIQVTRDMSIVNGHHRLSVALSTCKDIRDFQIDVDIIEDDKVKSGIIYFDKKQNRLCLKDKHPALFLVYQGWEIKAVGVFTVRNEAERWAQACTKLNEINNFGEDYRVEELELNKVKDYEEVIQVKVFFFDLFVKMYTGSASAMLPRKKDEDMNRVVHNFDSYNLKEGYRIPRYCQVLFTGINCPHAMFQKYYQSLMCILETHGFRLQECKDDARQLVIAQRIL